VARLQTGCGPLRICACLGLYHKVCLSMLHVRVMMNIRMSPTSIEVSDSLVLPRWSPRGRQTTSHGPEKPIMPPNVRAMPRCESRTTFAAYVQQPCLPQPYGRRVLHPLAIRVHGVDQKHSFTGRCMGAHPPKTTRHDTTRHDTTSHSVHGTTAFTKPSTPASLSQRLTNGSSDVI